MYVNDSLEILISLFFLKEIARYLIGQDPRDIEKHWQTIYRGCFYRQVIVSILHFSYSKNFRNGPILTSALSCIEQALWDILGKQ